MGYQYTCCFRSSCPIWLSCDLVFSMKRANFLVSASCLWMDSKPATDTSHSEQKRISPCPCRCCFATLSSRSMYRMAWKVSGKYSEREEVFFSVPQNSQNILKVPLFPLVLLILHRLMQVTRFKIRF